VASVRPRDEAFVPYLPRKRGWQRRAQLAGRCRCLPMLANPKMLAHMRGSGSPRRLFGCVRSAPKGAKDSRHCCADDPSAGPPRRLGYPLCARSSARWPVPRARRQAVSCSGASCPWQPGAAAPGWCTRAHLLGANKRLSVKHFLRTSRSHRIAPRTMGEALRCAHFQQTPSPPAHHR
jgi:hypothetical protein